MNEDYKNNEVGFQSWVKRYWANLFICSATT
jgi:hypothetical protein